MMPPTGKSTKLLQKAGEEGVGPGGWRDILILPYVRRLGPYIGVQILNFKILVVFQKDEYFSGGGGITKLWIF